MVAVFDIESNGMYDNVTKIHCIAIKVDEEETKCYTNIDEALEILQKADVLVAHNGIKYDIPVINKLHNIDLFPNRDVFDTLLVSKLCYPNMMELDLAKGITGKLVGKHSLKSWGVRLGNHKIDFGSDGDDLDAWEYLTDEMIDYCIQDVNVTYDLYKHLLTKNTPKEALWLENNFANIIGRQERYGVYFDLEKAQQLHVELLREKERMIEELHSVFKPLYLPVGQVKTQANYKKPFPVKTTTGTIYGSFQPIVLTPFNPSSRQHIYTWFKRWYNWKPKELTDKGSAKVDETILNGLEYPEAKILAHYFNVNKLLGQVAEGDNAWLKMVKKDGRIHGSVDTLGAVSRRCTHSKPNMAQVPSSRAFKGKECRSLFTVPKGKKLVGCDADGLELRTLSHYMARYDDGAYAKTVDEGKKDNGTDIHTVNQKATGLATRDEAKTFIYAFL